MARSTTASAFVLALAAALMAPASPASAVTKSTQKVFAEPKDDRALVYFIREPRFQGSARTMFLYADETFLGVLDNNSYTYAYVEPGKHIFWLNWARISDEVELAAGEVYYFSVWTRFDKMEEETARLLIDGIKFYATPDDKEVQKAEKHVRERHGKAEKYAAKPKKEYVGTKGKREEHVERWTHVDLSAYPILYVEDLAMGDPKAAKRKKEHLVKLAPKRIADQVVDILGEGVFAEVRRGPMTAPVPGAVVLRGTITQYKPGSAGARLMVAGAGSAHLDFTASLVDGETGDELTHLSGKRTWGWGGALGASRGIEDIERNVAYELALYLKRCKQGEDATIEEKPGG
ncbi:MAG: DUF4410 domain-containing protein [Alphaproteobacteria bacterium]|nr:MAG: DUF4410 domain-containing protein [Alphaproteobacteria bacterium]